MYLYNEVYDASLKYFANNELAAKIFVDKYALRNEKNELVELTPDDMHRRLAKEFARIESKKFKNPLSFDKIYNFLKGFKKGIPQGSPISAIGNPYQLQSTSNCFVVKEPFDSYGGILTTDQHIVQISKRRGGIGYDISSLRPKNLLVKNAAKTTSGAISFMHRFSNTGREVCQDGRRGAQMITISVHHPDIAEFITIKNDETSVTGANISVRLTNEFLSAVEKNEEYQLRWPVDSDNPKITQMVSAKNIWDLIIHNAWLRAEPGILFWDNIIQESPADCYLSYKTASTNPCGEIPLSEYDSCRLFAINLFGYVKNPFTEESYFDDISFYNDVQLSQRLMDDLIDIELEQIDKIINKIQSDLEPLEIKQTELNLWNNVKNACFNGRRTGLGITGLGDTLASLGLKYGSKESIIKTSEIYKTLKFGAYRSSIDIAKELGSFPDWNYDREKNNPFLNRFKNEFILSENSIDGNPDIYGNNLYEDMKKYGRRNIALLTTAPTGTISCLAAIGPYFNTTSGIEPSLYLESIRRKKINHNDKDIKIDFTDKMGDKWTEFKIYHSGFQLWKDISKKSQIKDSPYYKSTAEEIDWENRVKLQSVAQKHIDHAISSTINLPNNVEKDEVSKIYNIAWKSGLKGVTVYRAGCRSGVILQDKTENKERPKELDCDVHHITVKGKPYFVLVGKMNGEAYEVFAGRNGFLDKNLKTGKIIKKKKGYKATFDEETELYPINSSCEDHEDALTRMVSIALRSHVPMNLIVKQLDKVYGDMTSFSKSIARALRKYIPNNTPTEEKCEQCETILVHAEGCIKCLNCGWSKC